MLNSYVFDNKKNQLFSFKQKVIISTNMTDKNVSVS